MSYPYLMATLPPLNFSEPAPLNLEELLELASPVLNETDRDSLHRLLGGEDVPVRVVTQYRDFQRSLDHELVLQRSILLGQVVNRDVRLFEDAPVALAHEIMQAHNPREAQQVRWYGLWSKLKQLNLGQLMNQADFFVYLLEWQLLLEKQVFKVQEGRQKLFGLVSHMLETSCEEVVP